MFSYGYSHLVNNGVEESPPSHPSHRSLSDTEQHLNPHQLFADLKNCNVGFKHFHPMPVTQNGGKLSGQSEMGGVWEWTSSVLEKHEGFKAMELYPGYTGDIYSYSFQRGPSIDNGQRTFSMGSTISFSADLGQLIPA